MKRNPFSAGIAACRRLAIALLLAAIAPCAGMAGQPANVLPGKTFAFPGDFGAHPAYRTEWWYVTGWLQAGDGKPLGFQVTFFRSATGYGEGNPSRFAPKQLIIAHAAISDPAAGRLVHDQKVAREGFDLAYAKTGDTDVKLDQWHITRKADGSYWAKAVAREFTLDLELRPSQPVLLQGDHGYSRKGPRPEQASYYYSEPQLRVEGSVTRSGRITSVTGTAWLDHEWSTSVLDEQAAGWDWTGINLDDGGALMAFRIRGKDGTQIWAHATLRDHDGQVRQFGTEEIRFEPLRLWRSPRTRASYPVAMRIATGDSTWELAPLQDDQELDSRQSTGAVYWEGAVTATRDGKPAGRGYLELTGYLKPLKL